MLQTQLQMQVAPLHRSKVAVVYLLWDEEPKKYLADAISGMSSQTYPHDCIEFLIVYNSHKPEHPSQAPYIQEEIEKHARELPHTTILVQEKNLGFSGGNNLGMQWAIDHGFDYAYLHNGDGYMGPDCMYSMVKAMDADTSIGAAQSLMLLDPEKDLINSSGNKFHYLGFGYTDEYRSKVHEVKLPDIKDIGYASGAAVMMRTQLLFAHGLWDEDYFMYHEDTDYSLRLKSIGKRVVLVRDSVFYHKYQFSKSIQKYFWMERNRYSILFVFFKLPTLLLLLPIFIPLEIGLFLFSLKNGWWREKLKTYQYWLQPAHWKLWHEKRKRVQKNRIITDKELLKDAVSGIFFQDASVENPLLTYIGNPVMKWYFKFIVRPLIHW